MRRVANHQCIGEGGAEYSRGAERGSTVASLIATLAIASILLGTAVANLRTVRNPLADSSFAVSHFLRLARSIAVSRTSFVKVIPVSDTSFVAFRGTSCVDASERMSDLELALPRGARAASTTWSICFTPRGQVSDYLTFDLVDTRLMSRTVEVALGGGVRIR